MTNSLAYYGVQSITVTNRFSNTEPGFNLKNKKIVTISNIYSGNYFLLTFFKLMAAEAGGM